MADTESAAKRIDEIEDEEAGGDGKRERSTIEFPYLDLEVAVEVTKAVYQLGGSSCGWDQLAAHMGQPVSSGGFRMKVMTARTFGLLTYSQGTIVLSDLGQRLCDPQQEKAARAD